MPATSPEALARKKAKRRKKQLQQIPDQMLPSYKITARRMLPRLPDRTKAELREMLTKAVENT